MKTSQSLPCQKTTLKTYCFYLPGKHAPFLSHFIFGSFPVPPHYQPTERSDKARAPPSPAGNHGHGKGRSRHGPGTYICLISISYFFHSVFLTARSSLPSPSRPQPGEPQQPPPLPLGCDSAPPRARRGSPGALRPHQGTGGGNRAGKSRRGDRTALTGPQGEQGDPRRGVG